MLLKVSLISSHLLSTLPYAMNPVLILPGFGNSFIDYISPLNKGEEYGFVKALENRGVEAYVVPIRRYDWLKIANGLIDKSYWDYSCEPKKLFRFYFEKTHLSICSIIEKTGQKPVLIGHSAGGWLARGMMAGGVWNGNVDTVDSSKRKDDFASSEVMTKDMIAGLVTLGTPHFPPSQRNYDNTRGAIQHVHTNYPGAYLLKDDIFYISIASKAVISDQKADFRSIESFAYTSYKQLLGREEDVDRQPG